MNHRLSVIYFAGFSNRSLTLVFSGMNQHWHLAQYGFRPVRSHTFCHKWKTKNYISLKNCSYSRVMRNNNVQELNHSFVHVALEHPLCTPLVLPVFTLDITGIILTCPVTSACLRECIKLSCFVPMMHFGSLRIIAFNGL